MNQWLSETYFFSPVTELVAEENVVRRTSHEIGKGRFRVLKCTSSMATGLYMAWELVAEAPVAFSLFLVVNGNSDPQSFVSRVMCFGKPCERSLRKAE